MVHTFSADTSLILISAWITATVDALPPVFSGLITPTGGITVSGDAG
jgi:hypothetical protein